MKKSCCGFGHRELYYAVTALEQIIERLITVEGVDTFLTGGMGNFDVAFSSAVRRAKQRAPHVQLLLVRAYFSNELNTHKDHYKQLYDSILLPAVVENVHYKAAIERRNRWMVDESDFVLSGAVRGSGGAWAAVQYAARTGKMVIDVAKQRAPLRGRPL